MTVIGKLLAGWSWHWLPPLQFAEQMIQFFSYQTPWIISSSSESMDNQNADTGPCIYTCLLRFCIEPLGGALSLLGDLLTSVYLNININLIPWKSMI